MSADQPPRRVVKATPVEPKAGPAKKVTGDLYPFDGSRIAPASVGPVVFSLEGNRLDFPELCCGCTRRHPDSVFVAYTNSKSFGGRKSCEFPVCQSCSQWQKSYAAALLTRAKIQTANAKRRWSLHLGLVVTGLIAIFAVFGLAASSSGTLCMLLFPLPVAVIAWVDCYRQHRLAALLSAECREAAAATDRIAPPGATEPYPVEYLDWYRDVRTFRFYNAGFAIAFATLNRSRLVRYHMD